MQHNPLFDALINGRYQLRIDIKEDATGEYHASHESIDGQVFKASSYDRSDAFRKVEESVKDAIFRGDVKPGW